MCFECDKSPAVSLYNFIHEIAHCMRSRMHIVSGSTCTPTDPSP